MCVCVCVYRLNNVGTVRSKVNRLCAETDSNVYFESKLNSKQRSLRWEKSPQYAAVLVHTHCKTHKSFCCQIYSSPALTSFFYRLPSFWLETTASRSFQYSTYYYFGSVLLLYYTAYINHWYLLRKRKNEIKRL